MTNNQKIIKAQLLSIKKIEDRFDKRSFFLNLGVKHRSTKNLYVYKQVINPDRWKDLKIGNFYTFSLEEHNNFWKLIDFELTTEEEAKSFSSTKKKISSNTSSTKPIEIPRLEKPKKKTYSFFIFLSGFLLGILALYSYSIGDWAWFSFF
jgi:hypothetical protein